MTDRLPFKDVFRLTNAGEMKTNTWDVVEVICVIRVS